MDEGDHVPVSAGPIVTTSRGATLTPLAPYPFPPTYLLTVDSANILLDCGAPDEIPEFYSALSDPSPSCPTPPSPEIRLAAQKYLQTLQDLAPNLHLVLLSHPVLSSLGLLPWLRSRCGMRAQTYATLPTREMGKWAVQEWVEARTANELNDARAQRFAGKEAKNNRHGSGANARKRQKLQQKQDVDHGGLEAADFTSRDGGEGEAAKEDQDLWDTLWKLTESEVDEAFRSVIAVRFTQPVHLSGPLKGNTLVAHRAGHTLGGALFTLRPSLSSSLSPAASASSFLYAPVFNHIKENHLDGSSLLKGAQIEETMRRMGVVVVGAERSLYAPLKRVDKEKALLDVITNTLQSGHSVFMPTDPCGRLVELLVLLEMHWSRSRLGVQFPLALVSRTGKEVVSFLRSLTEWMGGTLKNDQGVLRFGHLHIFTSLEDLTKQLPPHIPKLVLTVPSSLSYGLARDHFVDFATQPGNVVILSESAEAGSLARWLMDTWNDRQADGEKWGQGKVGKVVVLNDSVTLEMKRKVYLTGDELAAHEENERQAAEAVAKRQALLDRSRRVLNEGADSDSDSDLSSVGEEEEAPELDFEPGRRRKLGGLEGGAGAWDEFLDAGVMGGDAAAATEGGGPVVGAVNFDIFVKGAYARRDGKEGLPRFRMFPVVERKRRVDAYGEAIDVEGWLRRGEEDNTKRLEAAATIAKRAREEAENAKPDPPHKYVSQPVQLQLVCSLFVIDFEGRADGRAIKAILPQINPRKLVVVDGSPEAISDLCQSCKNVAGMTQDIFSPALNECITVGEETRSYAVQLGDSIMSTLKMSPVDDYEVAYISGVLRIEAESSIPVLERASMTEAIRPSAVEEEQAEASTAEEKPCTEEVIKDEVEDGGSGGPRKFPPLAPSLFIGDLRLTLLKDRLKSLNVPSEFAGEGVLVCGPAPMESFSFVTITPKIDLRKGAKAVKEATQAEAAMIAGGKVAVRKVGKGRLVLEGSPGETFHVVRKAVYSLHAHAG